MYSLKSGFCLPKTTNSRWATVDVAHRSVQSLFVDFTKCYLTIYSDVLEKDIIVDMDQFRTGYSSFEGTIEEFLEALGDNTIETVESLPTDKIGYLHYSDARQAGYHIDTARAGFIDPNEMPGAAMDDLVMVHYKNQVDMKEVMENCLITVNGFFHRTSYIGDRFYVINGNKSAIVADRKNAGIHSYLNIGKIQQHDIDISTIRQRDDDVKMKDKLWFKLPEEIGNKPFFLILGGYLVPCEEGILYEDGSGGCIFHMGKIPYLDRLFESSNFIDLSSLELNKTEISKRAIHEPTAMSDEGVIRYFSLSQTFLVSVDTSWLKFEKRIIRHRSYPNALTMMAEPKQPLMAGHGRMTEYVKNPTGDTWNLNTDDSYLRNYLASEVRGQVREHIIDNMRPTRTSSFSHGHLLSVAGYKTL